MKLDARRTETTLKTPGEFSAILLFGENHGLIRERADTATKSAVGTLDDPFRLSVLEPQDHARLSEEATALSLTGGARAVRIRDAGDSLTNPIAALLDSKKSSLLIIEAPDLAYRSKLRALAEKRPDIAAIPCYLEEGSALSTTIRTQLSAEKVGATPEALTYLTTVLAGDRAATRNELEKLALYAGPGGTITLEDAEAIVGDPANLEVEDALFAATDADPAATDRALALALAEGAVPVQILRAAQAHLQRLLRAKLLMRSGLPAEEAQRALKPPIFFRRAPAFTRALNRFNPDTLIALGNQMLELEFACKQTGARDDTLARYALIAILRAARR